MATKAFKRTEIKRCGPCTILGVKSNPEPTAYVKLERPHPKNLTKEIVFVRSLQASLETKLHKRRSPKLKAAIVGV